MPQNRRYAVVIEQGEEGYGAYVPDLPGCVAVAPSRGEVERLTSEAVALHSRGCWKTERNPRGDNLRRLRHRRRLVEQPRHLDADAWQRPDGHHAFGV